MTLALPEPHVPVVQGDTFQERCQRNFQTVAQNIDRPVPQARVFHSVDQSIANTTHVALTFDSERFDDGGLHNAVNPTRLTAPVTGLYLAGAAINWDSNATGDRLLALNQNGVTLVCEHSTKATAIAGFGTAMTINAVLRLAAGDYLEARVYQNSGGALNVLTLGNYSPEFWMVRLSGYAGEQFT